MAQTLRVTEPSGSGVEKKPDLRKIRSKAARKNMHKPLFQETPVERRATTEWKTRTQQVMPRKRDHHGDGEKHATKRKNLGGSRRARTGPP